MALYKVLKTSFIGDKLVEPEDADGNPTYVEYDGEPGANLELAKGVKAKGVEAHGAIVKTEDADDLA